MSEGAEQEAAAEALRIQRMLESTLDRHAGQGEAARTDALVRTLQTELAALPKEARSRVVEALDRLNPEEEPVVAPSGGPAQRRPDLEAEIERLRAEVAALSASSAAALPAGDLTKGVAQVLMGSEKEAAALLAADPTVEQRLLEQVKTLMGFVALIGRSFLAATAEADSTVSGRIHNVLAAELAGRAPAGSFSTLLQQIQHQIGGQLYAFREACDAGAQNLLRQLAPAAIAAEASREAVSVAGWRPFSAREQWERFEAKFEALRRADNLYETYFDGAFRKVVHRLTREIEEGGKGPG